MSSKRASKCSIFRIMKVSQPRTETHTLPAYSPQLQGLHRRSQPAAAATVCPPACARALAPARRSDLSCRTVPLAERALRCTAGASVHYENSIKAGHPDAAVVHSLWGESLYYLSMSSAAPEETVELRQAYEHLNLGEWSEASNWSAAAYCHLLPPAATTAITAPDAVASLLWCS